MTEDRITTEILRLLRDPALFDPDTLADLQQDAAPIVTSTEYMRHQDHMTHPDQEMMRPPRSKVVLPRKKKRTCPSPETGKHAKSQMFFMFEKGNIETVMFALYDATFPKIPLYIP